MVLIWILEYSAYAYTGRNPLTYTHGQRPQSQVDVDDDGVRDRVEGVDGDVRELGRCENKRDGSKEGTITGIVVHLVMCIRGRCHGVSAEYDRDWNQIGETERSSCGGCTG
jgi:hypothetical protein